MATIQQQIAEKFLAKLTKSKNVDPEKNRAATNVARRQ